MTLYIPFKQYFRPNGRSTMVNFSTENADVHTKARQIIDAGFHFECEVLSTGHGSFTIGDHNGDYAHILVPDCQNNTYVVPAIEQMILDFDINGDYNNE